MAMNYTMYPVEKLGITRDEAERNSQARSWKTLEIKTVSKKHTSYRHIDTSASSYFE